MALAALIVAVVAATVAVVSFIWTALWSIWQHRQVTQGKLYVSAAYATSISPLGAKPVFSITVTNAGMVPVTINAVFGKVKGTSESFFPNQWLFQTPGPLPQKLAPGDTWDGHLDPGLVTQGAMKVAPSKARKWKLTIVVKDAAGRRYEAPTVKTF
jgi:hypothetical protein